ncbi:hypothetical protein [Mycetocola sp.]|uniref:hypothetical protein n=1 Tax=Mycetocola sp. TaxID=1871042 RepID=UPI0039890E74
MPDLSNVTTPVEWVVTHSASKEPIALVRRLRLGAQRELYFRAVTWRPNPARRELVGYWGSLEEAVQNVYGLYERSLPPQFHVTGGGTARELQRLTKPKPPPASVQPATPAAPVHTRRPTALVHDRRMPTVRQPARPMEPRQLATAGR